MRSRGNNRIIEWLLETDNPSVRYFTLRDLLDRNARDSELKEAKDAIANSKGVTKIFSKQTDDGYWEDPENPYFPKYKASYWTLMLLGQLGMDKSDKRVKRACEYIFRFQHKEGGFSSETKKTALHVYYWHLNRGRRVPVLSQWLRSYVREGQLSCLTGNLVAAFIRMGYGEHPRVKKALQWLIDVQNKDGGWLCPYWRAHIKDKHGCFFGTICPLEALSEVPQRKQTKKMIHTIERGAAFLLMHRLFKADHHGFKVIRESWLRLGFPWFYSYNVLRGLDVLTKLGYTKDKRMHDAVEILMGKRRRDGSWILEHTPAGRMHVPIGTQGKSSKWVTLIALRTLKRLGGT